MPWKLRTEGNIIKMELSEENLAQAYVGFSRSTWSSVCWIILEMSISVCYPQATRVGSHNCGALFLGYHWIQLLALQGFTSYDWYRSDFLMLNISYPLKWKWLNCVSGARRESEKIFLMSALFCEGIVRLKKNPQKSQPIFLDQWPENSRKLKLTFFKEADSQSHREFV